MPQFGTKPELLDRANLHQAHRESDVDLLDLTMLVRLIPAHIRTPSVYREDHGDIVLSWHYSLRRSMSVFIGNDSRLTWVVNSDGQTVVDVAVFDGKTIPAALMTWLETITQEKA